MYKILTLGSKIKTNTRTMCNYCNNFFSEGHLRTTNNIRGFDDSYSLKLKHYPWGCPCEIRLAKNSKFIRSANDKTSILDENGKHIICVISDVLL